MACQWTLCRRRRAFRSRDAINMVIAGTRPGLVSLSPENNDATHMGWALLLYEPPCAFGLLSVGRAEIDSCWRGAEGQPPPASLRDAFGDA